MTESVWIEGFTAGDSELCRRVLTLLPDWFGIEEAVDGYVEGVAKMPMLQARSGARAVGFLSFEPHFSDTLEIYCMAVLPESHRIGAGRALVKAFEQLAREQSKKFLLVKTLGPSDPDPFYARTRAFYSSVGFSALVEMSEIWGPENPCLLMVKSI